MLKLPQITHKHLKKKLPNNTGQALMVNRQVNTNNILLVITRYFNIPDILKIFVC